MKSCHYVHGNGAHSLGWGKIITNASGNNEMVSYNVHMDIYSH